MGVSVVRAFAVSLVAIFALAGVAHADTSASTQATAEALFKEGQRLMKAGQFAQACPKFADSQRLDPAVGTLLNLAACYEKNGQTASAWATYREAQAAAREVNQTARQQLATQRADALEPLLAHLTIIVTAPSDALEIRRDGVVIPMSGWGLAVPVDPGEHTIDASAPKHKPWSRKVQVAAKEQSTVTVPTLEAEPELPPPPAASVAPPPPPATAAPPPTPPPAQTVIHVYEPPPETPGSAQRTWGVVLGVTGLVVIGASIGLGELGAKREWDKSNQNNLCVNDVCTPKGQQHRDDARTIANILTLTSAGGALFVAGGIALYVTAPSAKPGAPKTGWVIAPTVGGVSMRGSF